MAWPNVYGLDVHRFSSNPAFPAPRPAILLVHDAFHGPAHFDALTGELAGQGLRVLRVQLPSSAAGNGRGPLAGALEADIRALVACGRAEIDSGRHLVVLAHGYGCVPGCVAADRLNRYSLDRPRTGEVRKLILLAGVVLRPGECYRDVLDPAWICAKDGMLRVRASENVFFDDCDRRDQAAALGLVRPQVENSLRTVVTNPGWAQIPALYIVCERDHAISARQQHAFARMLREVNRQSAVVSIQTGHCPFISRTDDVATLITRNLV